MSEPRSMTGETGEAGTGETATGEAGTGEAGAGHSTPGPRAAEDLGPAGAEPRPRTRRALSVDEYVAGVRAGDRAILGRAITLIESAAPAQRALADEVLQRLLPATGGAHRVGITGVPGVGKSTFIEALGTRLTSQGRRVAVLAIDPTSTISGGSILGDKTRMGRLSSDPHAFIRPSPSVGTLGGVARRTRETMLVCEAAGFDVVLVETVGIGQSEVVVADMVDVFLVLLLPGAGDELQGIKRGVIELADLLAVNKADGENIPRAERAASEYRNALHYLKPVTPEWKPPVLTVSAFTGEGLDALWGEVERHRQALEATGAWAGRRRRQMVRWLWTLVEERLHEALHEHPRVREVLAETEAAVEAGRLTSGRAAERVLQAFGLPNGDAPRRPEEGERT